jgi:[ribosomal protein S5]-alanine N-acetyltransferase
VERLAFPGQPSLCTDRLLLRPFLVEDAPDVRGLAGDAAVADTALDIPHPFEDGMAEGWIATHAEGFQAGKLAVFAVTAAESGELCGAGAS